MNRNTSQRPPKLDFIKNQVLVAEGMSNGQRGIHQVVFVSYIAEQNGMNCVIKDTHGSEHQANSKNLANIMWAEEVMARKRAHFSYSKY